MSLKVLFLYYAKPVKHHFCFLASTIVLHFTILFSCLCEFGPSKKCLYVASGSWFGEYLRGREKSDISVLSLESLMLFHTIKCFFQSTHMFTMSFVRPLSCIWVRFSSLSSVSFRNLFSYVSVGGQYYFVCSCPHWPESVSICPCFSKNNFTAKCTPTDTLRLEPDCVGSNPTSTAYHLRDFGQILSLFVFPVLHLYSEDEQQNFLPRVWDLHELKYVKHLEQWPAQNVCCSGISCFHCYTILGYDS